MNGVSPRDLTRPVTDGRGRIKLLLAGEACHPEWFSTVHGAFESGRQQAKVLLKSWEF